LNPVESLVDLVIRADAFLRQKLGMPSSRFRPEQRVWMEPFFNGVGHLVGFSLLALPGSWRDRVHIWICGILAQHAPEAFPDQSIRQKEAIARAQALYEKTGHWPAILFLTSHPQTVGASAWLRFELLRQGLWIAKALMAAMPGRPRHSHPQCFLAIDPFALDSVPVAVGAAYAGFMHNQYIVWDRQSSSQSWLQKKWLLKDTGHDRVAWRLLRALKRNPVLMVIAGGLPHNARLFYAAREWAGTLHDQHGKRSKNKIRYVVMDILSQAYAGHLPGEDGHIPSEAELAIKQLLSELGYAADESERLLQILKKDFKEEIPMRLRLWKILYNRLARRGIPLLVLPITHYERQPHVRLGRFFELTSGVDVTAFAQEFNAFYGEAPTRL